MAIFPGGDKKPVKKFANGGQALAGVGITYAPRIADVPNVQAAQFQYQEQVKQDAYLQQEREKRKVDRRQVNEYISKLPGTAGQKQAYADAVSGQLDDYEKRGRQDPYWLFSPEGQDAYADIVDATVNPGKAEDLRNNYGLIQGSYDALNKAGSFDSFQINNGQVLVKDNEDGQVKEIPLNEVNPSRYKPVTGRERYNELFNSPSFNPNNQPLYNTLISPDTALKQLLSSFDSAGGSITSGDGITTVQSNIGALNAAKNQALASMSNEVASALQSQYLKTTNGNFTEKGFSDYVSGILDNEIQKRRKSTKDVNIPNALLKAQGSDDRAVMDPRPTYETLNTETEVIDADYRDEPQLVHIQGQSMIPVEQKPEDLVINGKAWSFGGDSGSESNFSAKAQPTKNLSADNFFPAYGQAKSLNKKYAGAIHLSDNIVPVTTGEVLDANFAPTKEVLDDGLMVVKTRDGGDEYNYGKSVILAGTPVTRINQSYTGADGQTYTRGVDVMQRKDGKYVVVKNVGVKTYTYNDDDHEQRIYVPMTRTESLRSLGVNYSPYSHFVDYFGKGDNFQTSGDGVVLLNKLATLHPQAYQEMKNQIMSGQKLTMEQKRYINEVLNHVRDKVEDLTIYDSFSMPKTEHTKRNIFDGPR